MRAQSPASAAISVYPVHVPTSNGAVILANATDEENYQKYGFAQVRRAGDVF